MSQSIKRNDACHCGSGKKYKKCCMASEAEPPTLDESGEVVAASKGGLDSALVMKVLGTVLIVAVVALVVFDQAKWAVGIAGCGAIVIGIIWAVLDPPKPSGGEGNPSGLNFGN